MLNELTAALEKYGYALSVLLKALLSYALYVFV